MPEFWGKDEGEGGQAYWAEENKAKIEDFDLIGDGEIVELAINMGSN